MAFYLRNKILDINKQIQANEKSARDDLRADIERGLAERERDTTEPAGFQYESGIAYGDVPPRFNTEAYLAAAVGWVYSCVTAIADSVAQIDIQLYKTNAKGEIEIVPNHPALDVLDRVNDFTTRFDHINLSMQYLELAGEAPWYIDRGSSGKGEPQSILLLRPDRLSIRENKDKTDSNPIAGYKYKVDGSTILDIERDELVFLNYPDPANPFRGKGTLMAAATTVDLDHYAEDYNKRFFYNSARPDSVITTDQKLSQQQKKDLRGDINRLYKGRSNSHKTAILESGMDWKPMALSQKDMEFLQQQTFSRDKILSIFRIHKSILAITDDVNLANAKVGEYVFMKYTIVPKMKRIIAQLNEFYLPMFNGSEQLFFSFDNPVPDDVESDLKLIDSALAKGWMTYNEIRAEKNLEDYGPDGDIPLVPNNVVPIDKAGSVTPAPQGAAMGESKGFKAKRMTGGILARHAKGIIERSAGGYYHSMIAVNKQKKVKRQQKKNQEAVEVIGKKIDQVALAMAKQIVAKKRRSMKAKEDERKIVITQYAETYLKSVASHERIFKTTTQLVFENQKEKILKRFPKKGMKKKDLDPEDYLLDEEDETTVMVKIYDPLVKSVVVEQGQKAARLVNAKGNFDLTTQSVQEYLKKRAYKFSSEVNAETNVKLAAALSEGVAAGESIPLLKDRVSELFDGMEDYRAERIARSEVVRGSNFAANEAYDQSGVVETLEWLTAEDERLCEFCVEMEGQTINLGDTFFDKGDSLEGKNGGTFDFGYEDIEFPPLHANCRCTIVPVIN